MKNRYNSLFVKLFTTFIILIVLIIVTFALSIKYLSRGPDNFKKVFHKNISYYTQLIIKEVGDSPTKEGLEEVKKQSGLDVFIDSPNFKYSTSGKLYEYKNPKFIREKLSENITLVRKSRFKHRDKFLVIKSHDKIFVLSNIFNAHFEFPYTAIGVALLISCLLITFSYYQVRCLFKPLDSIKAATDRFAAGDFDYNIEMKTNNQFDDISSSISVMAKKIKSMLEAKRELLLAIAHEIRTPITTAKLHLEFLENSSTRAALNDQLDLMNKLISDIIESEKMNSEHHELNLENCSVNYLIKTTLETYFPTTPITINEQADETVELDFLRYQLVIKNIVQNAITHSHTIPQITIEKSALVIRDFGPGIPAEQLEHITEAFYRADKARVRTSDGGVGLGLYLTSHIINAHKHKLRIYNDNGAIFRIDFSL